MSAVTPQTTSTSEIAALLIGEVTAGVQAANAAVAASALNVDGVIVRVGQSAATFDEVAWQSEIHLGHGATTLRSPAEVSGARLPEVLASLGVDAIEGISNTWRTRLGSVGLGTVGELAAAEHRAVQQLVTRFDSRRPLAFWARAAQCRISLPNDATGGDPSLSVGVAVGYSGRELADALGLPLVAAELMVHTLSNLSAALDLAVLDRLLLRDLVAT